MKLYLPDHIFIRNRVIQHGELDFRLEPRFLDTLTASARADASGTLPAMATHTLLEVIALAQHLAPLMRQAPGHLTPEQLNPLVERINLVAQRSPDGCIAAILLCPWQDYTAHHAINSALLACRLGQMQGLSDADRDMLMLAALTMNVGAVALHNELAVQDAPLSTSQRQVLNAHPLISSCLLRAGGFDLRRLHTLVLTHHERLDGRGYPFHLRGSEIDPLAHTLHVLDIVIAKLMPRGYRSRLPARQALAQVYAKSREQLDANLTTQLVKLFGVYPSGSFVTLENGQTALVVKQSESADKPLVALPGNPQQMLDTSAPGRQIAESIASQPGLRHFPSLVPFWPLAAS
ncbi:HD-GYP domain-containing protein (c-di-GMP phosphodiesterase class II) [Silvimonas terrae]|uniref:HD-GYP domain-containing protein (C-di-GMP phosphodiesterase class II) n=1 Tax=Silvimonas terrae TaxID=300266 RepID=A0A840RMG0_9NEIS|nr:HD domain-containing phosphohydrolase [Silvimonas terrae]MBB5193281.1 HD-GYP domain-containing protein (c-di-GMP phosphodiesterase class II) [Silvimonas terrae]